jgi:hypothetical protein
MLAGRAAAKVHSHYQDRGTSRIGLIERESFTPDVAEEQLPVPVPADSRKKAGGNNAVCVDIVVGHHHDRPAVNR